MKRQVRMLLTRLSTNLHSRSIRGVARTLAIVALLFVSQLIGGADAFAEGVTKIYGYDTCPGCITLKRNFGLNDGQTKTLLNGQQVEYVNIKAPGYSGRKFNSYPTAVTSDGRVLNNENNENNIKNELNNPKKQEAPEPPDQYDVVMKDGSYGDNAGIHAIPIKPPQKKNDEQGTPGEINSPGNQGTCPGCSPGGRGGGRGGGGRGRGPLSRIGGGRRIFGGGGGRFGQFLQNLVSRDGESGGGLGGSRGCSGPTCPG